MDLAQKGRVTRTDVAMDDGEATVAVETVRQAVEAGQAVSRPTQIKARSRPRIIARRRIGVDYELRQALLDHRMPGMTASYSHGGRSGIES